MIQAVSRQPVTAEAWVSSQASPCGICGGQSGTVMGVFSQYFLLNYCNSHSSVTDAVQT